MTITIMEAEVEDTEAVVVVTPLSRTILPKGISQMRHAQVAQ